ncbi:hypothetical protein SAMN05216242_12241 [Thauera chlorobenzoica]|nr:hypothetical protein SAMN05216242_12241 [Thauera chlorobenzoica]
MVFLRRSSSLPRRTVPMRARGWRFSTSAPEIRHFVNEFRVS